MGARRFWCLPFFACCALVAVNLAGPGAAVAQPDHPQGGRDAERPPALSDEDAEASWYGWQLLAADAASAALLIGGSVRSGYDVLPDDRLWAWEPVFATGRVSFSATGPLVHGMHGNKPHAWLSFALRLGLPMALGVSALAGRLAASGENGEEHAHLIGVGAGTLIASAADAAMLAFEPNNVGERTRIARRVLGVLLGASVLLAAVLVPVGVVRTVGGGS